MPYIETPPRVASDNAASGRPRARVVMNQFHAGAPPRAYDVDLDFDVIFHDEQFAYKVKIKLYEYGTELIVPWARPIPKVSVTYWTELGQRTETRSIQLQFVHDQMEYATFFEDKLDFDWEEFLVIGMQFDQQTVTYYHITPQGQREQRIVDEMRRTCLSTNNTYADGNTQIWGTRFSGRGENLFETYSVWSPR